MDIVDLQQASVVRGRHVDASAHRERQRQRRLRRLLVLVGVPLAFFWYRELFATPLRPGMPDLIANNPEIWMSVGLMALLASIVTLPMLASGRSPHQLVRPSDSDIRLADVVGADQTRREAIDSLNLFLNHRLFAEEMGGSARRGLLFEGPPGTGKTYLAKAMAAEAGVPFLFVSASSFQSMYFGGTNRKIRTFFRHLRKQARKDGGAIGFIEEFDAIGGARAGMGGGGSREGTVGVVNELLVQMQSFDTPAPSDVLKGKLVAAVNSLLPASRAIRRPASVPANILVIAATNRAADLDPALLRPGRFDRLIHFDLPPHNDRLAIAGYYLAKKAHHPAVTANFIADLSGGYSPVRIERLLDEALIVALRRGRRLMTTDDVIEAQLTTEVGLSQEVGYHPDERRRVAVHEAGHALLATLVGRDVKIASILRRGSALGLVQHADAEERHLRTPSEGSDLIAVAMAGRAAEIQEYGEASSGIASDLAAATTIASQLVGQLGAANSLLSLEAAHLGMAGNLVAKVLGDEVARGKAEAIVSSAADRAACAVLEHRAALIALADALCEHDELTGDEVHSIVAEFIAA